MWFALSQVTGLVCLLGGVLSQKVSNRSWCVTLSCLTLPPWGRGQVTPSMSQSWLLETLGDVTFRGCVHIPKTTQKLSLNISRPLPPKTW